MTTLYAVIYTIGGYAREDASVAKVGGIYTNEVDALVHALVVHGEVVEVELDKMPVGILETAKQFGIIKCLD